MTVGAIASTACSLLFPQWTYRYRLTVDVEQNGRLYSGSSVILVRREKGIGGVGGNFKGEAVSINLGDGKTLFALLRGDNLGELWPLSVAHKAFAGRLNTSSMTDDEALTRLTRLKGESAVISTTNYPLLVTFRSLDDPSTVELVDPRDLASRLGQGTRLKRITIQITDDPITYGIGDKLRWLGRFPEPALVTDPLARSVDKTSPAAILTHGNFRHL